MHSLALALTAWLLATPPIVADAPGNAPVQIFPVAPLGASFQNLGVSSAPDGRVVVANNSRVLLFDGAHWQVLKHPTTLTAIWSVVAAADGRLYTAVDGDIGWFEPDAAGDYQFQSQTARLPAEARDFATVYHVVGAREGIWYNPTNHLLLLRPDGEFQVFTPKLHYSDVFQVGDSVWIQEIEVGLKRPVADGNGWRLELVPGSEYYADHAINGLADLGADGVLLVSGTGEIRRWHADRLDLFAPELTAELAAVAPKRMLALSDGNIAISNTRDGPWVIDRQGKVRERYSDANGVPALQSYGMVEDGAGGLWIAQEHAMVRIDRGSGLSHFGRARGLPEAQAIEAHQGELYAGALAGIYRLSPGEHGIARFERIKLRGASFAFDLESAGDWLWIAGNGLRRARFDASGQPLAVEQVSGEGSAQCRLAVASRLHADRIYGSCNDGIFRIDAAASAAPTLLRIAAIEGTVSALVEADGETLWASVSGPRMDRLREQADGSYLRERFDAGAGIPASGRLSVFPGVAGPWFTSNAGLLRFDERLQRFEVRTDLPMPHGVSVVHEDAQGNLWARSVRDDVSGVWWRRDDGYAWDGSLFAAHDPASQDFEIERIGDVVWLARPTGATRLDLNERQPPPAAVMPRISAIRDSRHDVALGMSDTLELPADTRDLRLRFALPAFVRSGDNLYRSRLAGFDGDWSLWDTRAERDYTNLPDGRLRFEVEARDAFGRVTAATPLTLHTLPPWWRTRAAFVAYIILALFALLAAALLGARWRQRLLLARQGELEAVVEQRTHELSEKNQQLAVQAERLTEIDRLKTRFFINVGHEFRTPLTLVLGPIDDLLRDVREKLTTRAREQLEMANRNARRVLDLIVELLDVNRFEHGQMRLTRVSTDIEALLRQVLVDHLMLAERHGHRLELTVDAARPLRALIDPAQIERALSNLIANAAKYMARGGLIELSLRDRGAEIEIEVADRGRGIAAAALPHVFDRFFQAEGGDRASGYGIGLALVREIVEGHQGRISVDSTLGVGSRFLVVLASDCQGESQGGPQMTQMAPMRADGSGVQAIELDGQPAQESSLLSATSASSADRFASASVEPQPRTRTRILVVDDHDDLRARVRGLLAERFEVIEANDGPSAWKAARDALPDLIVCDVMMPGFDGIELTRRLRADADTAAIGLLLLTAKVGSEHAVAGLSAGADDYLAKPFDASELIARVDAILAHAQRLRLRLAREALPPAVAVVAEETPDQRWRRRLDEHIQQHLDDPELSVETLAAAMHADRSALFRKAKDLLGMSPSEYLRDVRLKRAHTLLQQSAGNISEIAYAVGFDSLSSFTRAFKTRYGVAPSMLGRAAG